MTELKGDKTETTIHRWTPQLFEQKKREAREMEVGKLPAFIEDCMERCERDDQAVGAMVLAGVAACTAALKMRKQRPHGEHIAMAALILYKEIMAIPGPLRVVVYDMMLRPGNAKHFAPEVDWQAAQWLVQEASGRLLNPSGMTSELKQWLGSIALGAIPYGWTAEKPPIPIRDGFRPLGRG